MYYFCLNMLTPKYKSLNRQFTISDRTSNILFGMFITGFKYDASIQTYKYIVEIHVNNEINILLKRYTDIVNMYNHVLSQFKELPPQVIKNFPGKLLINSPENINHRMDKMNECLESLCYIQDVIYALQDFLNSPDK